MVFLGILLHGEGGYLVVPEEKQIKAIDQLSLLISKRKVKVLQIQQLTGLLNFLNCAIVPGRAFTRRMYAKFATKYQGKVLKQHHHVLIDNEFRSDCQVWLNFLNSKQTLTLCRPFIDVEAVRYANEIHFYTKHSIFRAVCMGIFTWREHLKNCCIIIFCDNLSVVNMVNSLSSKCRNCMYLIRLLVLAGLSDNRRVFVSHVRTFLNKQADYLSRLKFDKFFQVSPSTIKPYPEKLPEDLWPASKLWKKA